jgi:hypothetical protein
MIPILENAVLGSDLECDNKTLLNVAALDPVPAGMVGTDDPRLIDQRTPTPNSVTNDSVADTAAIDQSKLSLDGIIPPSWLGVTATQAAQGNLAEFLSHKESANGYCGLDANGKVLVGRLPTTGPQSGTVTHVELMLPEQFSLSGSPITTSGTFAASWVNVANDTWFGVWNGKPEFISEQIPLGMIPSLDGNKFGSGEFPVAMLPIANGMGLMHSIGLVPDPGDGSKGMDGDYLGRDMSWRHFDMDTSYQPMLPDVLITVNSYINLTEAYVTVRSKTAGSSLFYDTGAGFVMVDTTDTDIHITFKATVGDKIKGYSAKAGYNNSDIAVLIVPPPPIQPQA